MNGEIAKLRLFNVVEPYSTDAILRANDGPKHTGRVDVPTVIELGHRDYYSLPFGCCETACWACS